MVSSKDSDAAAREQLSAHPSQLPTHPQEEKLAANQHFVPDGVSPPVRHPLDPLTADEINLTTRLLQSHASPPFASYFRIITIIQIEPSDKTKVAAFQIGDYLERRVSVVIRDPKSRTTYEAIADLTNKKIERITERKDGQPGLTFDEMIASDHAMRTSEQLIAAFAKRNVSINDIVFYPFAAGYRDENDSPSKRRIFRPLSAVTEAKDDNYYAHPIEGLVITVDLDTLEVTVEDYYIVPIPKHSGRYDPESIRNPNNIPHFPDGVRKDLKPLVITQPEGPSFQLDGYQISWQKWRFRVGFNAREGLTIHTVEYFDQQRWRSILHRGALCEMWVPYGDSGPGHSYKNVFDLGEAGLGLLVNSLVLGCDCLGEIRYLDVILNNNQGKALLLKNAICIHEEDHGMLWKHTEFVDQRTEVRRSRRLVVSCVATVGNYEYGIYWYFQQDGTIHYEIKLTGIIAPGAYEPGHLPISGGAVAPGLYGPYHQHFFNVRLHWALDGPHNSLVEVNCEPLPRGSTNPIGNAWTARETVLSTPADARRSHDAHRARHWKIVNPQVKNHVDLPVAYKLVPMSPAIFPLCLDDSLQACRGAFTKHHLWATPFNGEELYAAGFFPNQTKGDDGVLVYSEKHKDESLEECDLVTWYTFGCTHIVRPEDWPVMPVETAGFRLVPAGFFAGNPSLDVPRSVSEKQGQHCNGSSYCKH